MPVKDVAKIAYAYMDARMGARIDYDTRCPTHALLNVPIYGSHMPPTLGVLLLISHRV